MQNVQRSVKQKSTKSDFYHGLLAMKGESLYKIATLMGNSPEICRRHYATLMPDALAQSVEFESGFAHRALGT